MTVKTVRKFASSDGRVHDSYQAAKEHEAFLTIQAKVKQFFLDSNVNVSVSSNRLLLWDLYNKPEIAQTLKELMNTVLAYHKRYGKLKSVKPAAAEKTKPVVTVLPRRGVKKYNLSGELLGTFGSAAEAASKSKCSSSNIQKVCRGVQKTAAGYVWAYNDEKPNSVEQ